MRKAFPLGVLPAVVTRALRSDSETRVRILRAQRAPPNPVIPVSITGTSNSHAEAVPRLRGCQRYRFLMFVGPLTSSSCFEAVMVYGASNPKLREHVYVCHQCARSQPLMPCIQRWRTEVRGGEPELVLKPHPVPKATCSRGNCILL